MTYSDNNILTNVTRILGERLPAGWGIDILNPSKSMYPALIVRAKNGRQSELPVQIYRTLDPRRAQQIDMESPALVIAPYLSEGVRAVLKVRGTSYSDQTGNTRVVLDEPGLFILTSGAEKNPWPPARRLSLRGIKAGRVVCALMISPLPIGVRALAEIATADPGYVSRLLSMLDKEALVERTSQGQVDHVDRQKLLQYWAHDAPLNTRASITTWLAPRGIPSVLEQLKGANFQYALTGSAAAQMIAPVTPTRLLSVYTNDTDKVAEELGLHPTDAGANIILLQPKDLLIYDRTHRQNDLNIAPLPLVIADLLSGSGRSPAEAKALMEVLFAGEDNANG